MKIIILIILLPAQILAQVVISEVLYNEPEATVALEWIELYNRADSAANLENYHLIIGPDTSYFLLPAIIPARQYAILSRHLFSLDSAPSFEGHWGDSSGFWGDCQCENYPAFDVRFSLPNSSGSVYLIQNSNETIDECIWTSSGEDGLSLERDSLDPPSSSWHQSTDSLGSTPGHTNSPKAQEEELSISISPRLISQNRGDAIEIYYVLPNGCLISIEIFDDSGHKQAVIANKQTGDGNQSWDGKSGDGKRLAPGVYMILSTISGSRDKEICTPVVLAP